MIVFDIVLFGRRFYMGLRFLKRDVEVVKNVLKKLGIDYFVLRFIRGLSGGEF